MFKLIEINGPVLIGLKGAHFDRDDVALPGFAQYFYKCGRKEHHKTKELLDYQNLRGGHVIMQPVDRPTEHEWDTPLKAVQFALKLEKQMNEVNAICIFVKLKHFYFNLIKLVICKFYANFMQILCKFYANFKQILSKFYANFMQILFKFDLNGNRSITL